MVKKALLIYCPIVILQRPGIYLVSIYGQTWYARMNDTKFIRKPSKPDEPYGILVDPDETINLTDLDG